MRSLRHEPRGRGDLVFLFAVLLLAAYGVICVYSASCYNAQVQYGDPAFYMKKQLWGFAVGAALMLPIAYVPQDVLRRLGIPALVLSALLLALVFVPGVGKSSYGATRWIGLGGVTIQPSELAKFALILFIAGYFAARPARMRTLKGVLPVLLAGGVLCVLVLLEPNLSVTMCLGAVMLGMIFLSGVSWRAVLVIALPAVALIPALILAAPYRLKRLSAFLDPWASPKEEGYQLIQSLYALANGDLFGVGLFGSRQKYRFLPFSESDFILSVIAEETGFVGIALLFALIGVIVWRGFCIAARCKSFYGYMLTCGIMLAFGVQTALNALVVSGCIPPTGLPLPLVSAGNTSLIVTMAGMGVVYGASRGQGNGRGTPRHKIQRSGSSVRS